MRYGYYPGCSLDHSAEPYQLSTLAVAKELGMTFQEIDDWNCCGATEYFSLNKTAAYALVGRNLALAEKQLAPGNGSEKPTLVAPCSACFLNLSKTDHYLAEYSDLKQSVDAALQAGGLSYTPRSLSVRHLLDVLVNDIGLDAIKAKVKKPLRNLRIAPYYGCLLTRPAIPGHTHDDAEYPTHMDELFAALGAEVVDYPLKTHCCGGHMTQISARTAYSMIYRLLRSADEYKADVIAVVCPMCQLNLDGYQGNVNSEYKTNYRLPILYFTQIVGMAFDLPAKALGLGRELVSSKDALAKIGVTVPSPAEPAAAKPAARKKGDKTLPMPTRLEAKGRKSRAHK